MKKILFIFGILVVLMILEIVRELHCFRIRRYKIRVPGLEGKEIKIMFLSDLHGKTYGQENEKLLEAMRREKPDLILSGGDILTRGEEKTDAVALSLLKETAKIAPLYMANGNHEEKLRLETDKYGTRYEDYARELGKAGLSIMENGSVDVEVKGFPITISGMELPAECYELFHQRELTLDAMKERIGTPDPSRYQILLAHNPVYMKQYANWGADLTLCGHLHGGIVRLPFIGGVVTPQAKFFPKYSGDKYMEDGHCGIVSRGLGTHTVNIRLFNMAEVVMITLI